MNYEKLTEKQEQFQMLWDAASDEKRAEVLDFFLRETIYNHHKLEYNALSREILDNLISQNPKNVSALKPVEQAIFYHARALNWIYQRARSSHASKRITPDDIAVIHQFICGHGDDQNCKVEYRKAQRAQSDNSQIIGFTGDCNPLTIDDHLLIPRKMDELVQFINKERAMHPVNIASYIHYKILLIHPFDSGNSHTAFLVSNLFLMLNDYPGVLLSPEDHREYVESIESARREDFNLGDQLFYIAIDRALDCALSQFSE